MRVAGLMSGKGSNLIKIIEYQRRMEELEGYSPYNVVVIFTDNPESNAEEIGREHGILVLTRDIKAFHKERGKPRRDLEVRAEFDRGTVSLLKPFEVDVIAYAGYMSIATQVLINAFLGVNVHPADLTIVDKNGKRKYTGDHAVRDAILAGEKKLRSTTHIVEPIVDYGRILMVSRSIYVQSLPFDFPRNKDDIDYVSSRHQDRLKEIGDWIIFPRTLEFIADGRYSQDEQGRLYFDDRPIPDGLKLEEIR